MSIGTPLPGIYSWLANAAARSSSVGNSYSSTFHSANVRRDCSWPFTNNIMANNTSAVDLPFKCFILCSFRHSIIFCCLLMTHQENVKMFDSINVTMSNAELKDKYIYIPSIIVSSLKNKRQDHSRASQREFPKNKIQIYGVFMSCLHRTWGASSQQHIWFHSTNKPTYLSHIYKFIFRCTSRATLGKTTWHWIFEMKTRYLTLQQVNNFRWCFSPYVYVIF